ncbi:MAG: 2-amino-4-hydroxy-6-hydroxymethyldihydropteridine diphosphokinase [Halieaceae bacterium]
MTAAYIALGSNLGTPEAQLKTALQALEQLPQSRLVSSSPWYVSKAIGPGTQPDYLNAVALLDTDLSPLALLTALQQIEQQQGRERGERWAARTLDLDILLYGNEEVASPELRIPHPALEQRNFVLYPLFDLAPDLTLPCGTPIESLLAGCSTEGLHAFGETRDPGL